MSQNPNPTQTQYGYAAAPVEDPGKTLGIVGLVLAFVAPLIGLIISIIARNQSKNAGFENKLAKYGIIASIIIMVLIVVIYVIVIIAALASGSTVN